MIFLDFPAFCKHIKTHRYVSQEQIQIVEACMQHKQILLSPKEALIPMSALMQTNCLNPPWTYAEIVIAHVCNATLGKENSKKTW